MLRWLSLTERTVGRMNLLKRFEKRLNKIAVGWKSGISECVERLYNTFPEFRNKTVCDLKVRRFVRFGLPQKNKFVGES
jgi:hypothetical protein